MAVTAGCQARRAPGQPLTCDQLDAAVLRAAANVVRRRRGRRALAGVVARALERRADAISAKVARE